MVFVDYYKKRKKDRSWLFVVSGILILVASIILIVISFIFIKNIKTKIANEIKLLKSEEKRLIPVAKLTDTIMKEVYYKREFLKEVDILNLERKKVLEVIDNVITLRISGYNIKEIEFKNGVIRIRGESYNNIIPAEYVSKLKNFLDCPISLDEIKKIPDDNYFSLISITLQKQGGEE